MMHFSDNGVCASLPLGAALPHLYLNILVPMIELQLFCFCASIKSLALLLCCISCYLKPEFWGPFCRKVHMHQFEFMSNFVTR
uniref:Uncharacterized protein n=1 Tax=Arundo donax TaxID=35708 RepID=A0A0A9AJ22_ARUDO